MDIKTFKNILRNVTPVSEDEWQNFEQYFSFRRLNKNEILWKENEICNHLIFLKKGLIYCFHYKDDKEIVTNLYFENAIFYDDYSFIKQEPCILNYIALEETELIVIPRVALYEMFDKYKSFERLGRMMVERNHTISVEYFGIPRPPISGMQSQRFRERCVPLISELNCTALFLENG